MKITFIQTGGTIDKDYPKTQKGWAFEIGDPAFQRVIEKLNPSFEYEYLSVLKKDSTEITQADRARLLKTCNERTNSKVIITHGTDTMIETGFFLREIKQKTILITGSMRPEKFSNSDAPINLGLAIGAVQLLSSGVYIAMHGQVLSIDNVTRDQDSGQFIALKNG